MVQPQIFNQMIQINKTAFNNGFNAMEKLRQQNEKMTSSLLDQAVWLPEGSKKAINAWMQIYKKGCNDFKKTVDQNYKNVEDFFAGFAK